jgi:hypothetical protein
MGRVARRLLTLALPVFVAACSALTVADEEIAACKKQIKEASGNDLSAETHVGSNLNVTNSSRSVVLSFDATEKHPFYICYLQDGTVTGILEQRQIYPSQAAVEG